MSAHIQGLDQDPALTKVTSKGLKSSKELGKMSFLTQRRQDIPVIQEGNVNHQQHPFQFGQLRNTNSPSRYQQNIQYLSPLPLEADIARLSHSPVSTTESSPATSTLDYDHTTDYYMQRTSQAVQETIPVARHPSLESLGLQHSYWEQSGNPLGAQQIRPSISSVYHKRNNSDGTIPSAPYTPTSFPQQTFQQPHIVDPEVHQYSPHQEIYDYNIPSLAAIPKSYPQTSQSTGPSSFSDFQLPCYDNAQSQLHWNAMSQTILQQQQQQRQISQFQRQSGHEMDQQEELNGTMQDKLQSFPLAKVPGLPRSISAICEDYNVAEPTLPTRISNPSISRANVDGHVVSPTNSVFSQRLQAANQSHLEAARSASPTATSFSGERSPFRTNSMMSAAAYESSTSPGPFSAAQLREKQRAEAAAFALTSAVHRTSRESSQTVSPKEVFEEYEPRAENDNQGVLFNSLPNSPRHVLTKARPSRLNQELTRSSTYENGEESGQQPLQVPQQYPFIRTHQTSGLGLPESSQESNPRFPATMISMESTLSGSKSSAPASPEVSPYQKEEEEDEDEEEADSEADEIDEIPQRPGNTRSDGGTYTCTYHGCTQRFETPQKLQKHKKEGHRQGTPSSNADSRLTQAGPHKCERNNPQTGKPCNSIFSRPYDLTRHEDTIHNAKKLKVRCRYCTEEKTFSRNDALTRHMRVVHPDIEFSGRSKRGSR